MVLEDHVYTNIRKLYTAAKVARDMLEEAARLSDIDCVPVSVKHLVIAVADTVTDYLLLKGDKSLTLEECEELERLLDEVQVANDRLLHAATVDAIADSIDRVIRALEKVLEYLGPRRP